MKDKQPQTCYVYANMNDWDKRFSVIGNEIMGCEHVKKLNSVYIHTPEELEALKAEWQREAAEKAWDACEKFNSDSYIFESKDNYAAYCEEQERIKNTAVDKETYLDQHYPLPQPINTNQ